METLQEICDYFEQKFPNIQGMDVDEKRIIITLNDDNTEGIPAEFEGLPVIIKTKNKEEL
jgi:hypothetical protein